MARYRSKKRPGGRKAITANARRKAGKEKEKRANSIALKPTGLKGLSAADKQQARDFVNNKTAESQAEVEATRKRVEKALEGVAAAARIPAKPRRAGVRRRPAAGAAAAPSASAAKKPKKAGKNPISKGVAAGVSGIISGAIKNALGGGKPAKKASTKKAPKKRRAGVRRAQGPASIGKPRPTSGAKAKAAAKGNTKKRSTSLKRPTPSLAGAVLGALGKGKKKGRKAVVERFTLSHPPGDNPKTIMNWNVKVDDC